MSTRINLWRALFGEKPRILLENSDFTVTYFRYDSGGEGLKIGNPQWNRRKQTRRFRWALTASKHYGRMTPVRN